METTTNNSNHELLRDVYASQLLVSLAKQAGFLAEPAVINLVNDEEFYTLSLMQKWLRETKKLHVEPVFQHDKKQFVAAISEEGNFSDYNNMHEGFNTFEEALEAGLKHAFHLLLYPK